MTKTNTGLDVAKPASAAWRFWCATQRSVRRRAQEGAARRRFHRELAAFQGDDAVSREVRARLINNFERSA